MLKPGSSFERYTIDAMIGQGGMGCVYRAHDPRLDRRVALKVISDGGISPDSTGRLLREARSAAALDHPNAVSIFDVGEADGTPYIVMELVDGQTLRGAVGQSTVPQELKLAWLIVLLLPENHLHYPRRKRCSNPAAASSGTPSTP